MNHSKVTLFLLLCIIVLSLITRFFNIGKNPPSLYSDEADQGYNAYSIFKTGSDEHAAFLPISLRSFGDWKPPLPTYLMIPFIASFGLTETSVRTPSALLGIGTIILTFYLIEILFKERKYAIKLSLLTALFVAISPWHILESRAAMLVMIALFFLEGGIYFFIRGLKNPKMFFISATFFVLSVYSYYGTRVITPLLILSLLIIYRKDIPRFKNIILASSFLSLILLSPLIFSFFRNHDVLFGRAKSVSVFNSPGVELKKWGLTTQDGIGANPTVVRFFHNNLVLYTTDIVQKFLSHFDGRFLFLEGDKSRPFQIPGMGILFLFDAIFLPIGLFLLFKNNYNFRYLIILWLVISVIPAALTYQTPASNRSFNMIIPLTILSSLGLLNLFYKINRKLISSIILSLFYTVSFAYFLRSYFIKLPTLYADFWNYGWQDVVEFVNSKSPIYDNVIISDNDGMPYVYFLFYNKYDPLKYQKEGIRTYISDKYGFEHVEGFDKYIFMYDFNWKYEKNNLRKNSLYVVSADQAKEDNNYIKAITYPDGRIAYKIFAHE